MIQRKKIKVFIIKFMKQQQKKKKKDYRIYI